MLEVWVILPLENVVHDGAITLRVVTTDSVVVDAEMNSRVYHQVDLILAV